MHIQRLFHRTWMAFAFVLLIAPWAAAQQYRIVRADYGWRDQRVDVTQRLRELARDRDVFRMGNSTFGIDPAHGHVKTLRIFAEAPDGQQRTFEYREGDTVDGSIFAGWRGGQWGDRNQGPGDQGPGPNPGGAYVILRAYYGVPGSNVDVTNRLRELARHHLIFRMGNSTFGIDPAHGYVKTLRIWARGSDGNVRVFEYSEGSTVDGRIFSGWQGGNWGRGAWQGDWNGGQGPSPNPEGAYVILRAYYGIPESNVDVTDQLRELAHDHPIFRMGNSTFGIDPAHGYVKILRIWARGPNGDVREFDYPEGSTVDGRIFSDWRGGNWGRGEWRGNWNGDRGRDRGRQRDDGH